MNIHRIRGLGRVLLSMSLIVFFVLMLWWKLQLGISRYFDADEFAYLHWAHNVSIGKIPMIDFLMYAPPGFLFVLAPLYGIWKGTQVLFVGRIFAWIIYGGIALILGMLLQKLRGENKRNVIPILLPGFILSVLAIPSDKFLEIRPDNLATLLALVSIRMLLHAWEKGRSAFFFYSGFILSCSLFILPKTLPFAVSIVGVLALRTLVERKSSPKPFKNMFFWFLGGAVPVILFLLWVILVSKDFAGISQIIYSLTKLPFEVNRISERFGMQADLFFYPNWTYYGQSGWDIVLLTNHALWLFGLGIAVIRLVTPFIRKGIEGMWQELLISCVFFLNVLAFFYGYPLRHAQYLIPIAVFIALYSADGFLEIGTNLWRKKHGVLVIPGAIGVMIFCICMMYRSFAPKLLMTNSEDVAFLSYVTQTIPPDAYVFDLVGSTIYYQDPYYVSAVPFGEWEPYLSRPLPSVKTALQRHHTQYIYAGRLGRLSSLSLPDQAYIAEHYAPIESRMNDLLVKVR